MNYFELLPNEIILKILSFLDLSSKLHFGILCNRFFYLARDGSLWGHVIWKRSSKVMDEDYLRSSLKLSKNYVHRLSLACIGKCFMFSKVVNLVQSCRVLEKISLCKVKLTYTQVKVLLQLPCLVELLIEPETYVPLIFKATRTISTSLKVLSFVETGNYYQRLLVDWSNSQYIPSCVKVLLQVNSGIKCRVIREITNSLLPIYPDKADLYIFQNINGLTFASSGLIFHLHYTLTGPLVYFNDEFQVAESSFIVNRGFGCDTATYYPTCVVQRSKTVVNTRNVKSLFIIYRDRWSSPTIMAIAEMCPNLTTLDLNLYNSDGVEGIISVIHQCKALSSLSLDIMESLSEMSRSKLWKSMGNLSNLHFLKVSMNLIPALSEPILFVSLESLSITKHIACQHRLIDKQFCQFSLMPAMKSFSFCQIPPITLYLGFSGFLKSVRLTHLHLEKNSGNKLTFPLNSECYKNLEEFHLYCADFVFPDQLSISMGNNPHLIKLSMIINFIEARAIKNLFDSLPGLMVFHITVSSRCSFRSNKIAKALSKTLLETAEKQRRNMDICLLKE